MSAATGLVMLYKPQIEEMRYADRIFVTPGAQSLAAEDQVSAVRRAHPDAALLWYRPGRDAGRSSEVGIRGSDARESTVFVDPYNARVLGAVEESGRITGVAKTIHMSLFLGDVGDALIEVAASLGIVLLVTGLYMWWPGLAGLRGALRVSSGGGRRAFWRSLHSNAGALISVVLLFYLVSGLAWTGVWGGRLVQAWSTYPAEKASATSGPDPHANHRSMNGAGHEIASWNLEQTPLPLSDAGAGAPSHGVSGLSPSGLSVDEAIRIAQGEGIGDRFTVALPTRPDGVFTVAATTMSGDALDPRDELTVHVDRYSGEVLARIGWSDYGLGARAMSTGIPLHQGTLGWWNQVLSTLACLAIAFLAGSGIVMWWVRRPAGAFRLAAPEPPTGFKVPLPASVTMLLLCVAFPLAGLAIVSVVLLDLAVISRVRWLQSLVS